MAPWKLKEEPKTPEAALTSLHSGPRIRANIVAKLEAGTLVSLKSCDRRWCHVSIGRFRGYIEQPKLWGIYPKEVLR